MAHAPLLLVASVLLFGSLAQLPATAAQEAAAPDTYDANSELENLKGWKTYLTAELEKCKAELEQAQNLLQTEQQRVAQLQQAVTDAEAKLKEAETKTAAAEALASSHSQYSTQLAAQIEQLQKEAAAAASKATEAESKASARAAAADASNSESAALRKQLAEAAKARQALEARVTELASAQGSKAAAAAGANNNLRGHVLAILDILAACLVRHRDTALAYVNEKLPGLKAQLAQLQAAVSALLPDVNVTAFVAQVDSELRPWVQQALSAVPALKPYGEDPVVLQAVVYGILGAPLLAVLPLLSSFYRCCSGRPRRTSVGPSKSARRNKKRQA